MLDISGDEDSTVFEEAVPALFELGLEELGEAAPDFVEYFHGGLAPDLVGGACDAFGDLGVVGAEFENVDFFELHV